eukprot:1156100-Pelagomonas_calceolata.AAC.6
MRRRWWPAPACCGRAPQQRACRGAVWGDAAHTACPAQVWCVCACHECMYNKRILGLAARVLHPMFTSAFACSVQLLCV